MERASACDAPFDKAAKASACADSRPEKYACRLAKAYGIRRAL